MSKADKLAAVVEAAREAEPLMHVMFLWPVEAQKGDNRRETSGEADRAREAWRKLKHSLAAYNELAQFVEDKMRAAFAARSAK